MAFAMKLTELQPGQKFFFAADTRETPYERLKDGIANLVGGIGCNEQDAHVMGLADEDVVLISEDDK
jgi:hypothetical protein